MVPYTYLIGWSALNKFYYGVRYRKGCHPGDLFVNYFTSSSLVKKLRDKIGEPDVIQIRQTFTTKDDARLWEHKVLRRLKASIHPKLLNLNEIQTPIPPPTSKQTGKKISIAKLGGTPWNKGITGCYNEEVRNKMSESAKRRGVISSAFKGKTHSEETKRKISEKTKGKQAWNKGLTYTHKKPRRSGVKT